MASIEKDNRIMMDSIISTLYEIAQLFITNGTLSGAIGGLSVISASYFVDSIIDVRSISVLKKILFVIYSGIIGGIIYYTYNADLIISYMCGATWMHVVRSFRDVIGTLEKSISKARQSRIDISEEEVHIEEESNKDKQDRISTSSEISVFGAAIGGALLGVGVSGSNIGAVIGGIIGYAISKSRKYLRK